MCVFCRLNLHENGQDFFFFFNGTKFTYAQYIYIKYALDSTRQEFDVWIGVAFMSDNETSPVQPSAEMRQLIQTSNFRRI